MVNIFKDGILIDIDVSFWSGAKALTPEDLGLNDEDVAEAFHLGRKMLVPANVIRAFRHIESQARRLVELGSFRFPIGNARFVPKKKFSKVLKELGELKAKYTELTEDLIANYTKYREEMIPMYRQAAETAFINQLPETQEFGIDYNRDTEKENFVNKFLNRIESFYPSAESLRSRYSISWSVYEVALPRMRLGDADTMATTEAKREIIEDEYQTQIKEKIGSFVSDVVKTLRQETTEICGRIIKNISEGRVVRSKTIDSLKNFTERFSSLNFVGDVEIEKQLESLRKEFLDTHSSEEIGEDTDLQAELKRKLGQLAESASNMTDVSTITGDYKRKISWEAE